MAVTSDSLTDEESINAPPATVWATLTKDVGVRWPRHVSTAESAAERLDVAPAYAEKPKGKA